MTQKVEISDISVLMPIKNGRSFLEHSLVNITQMANGAEILLIDDHSTDGSFEYCQKFSEDKSQVRVERNPGVGICDALNFGIAISTRAWIARFDVDDAYFPNRLIEQVELLNSSDASVVFSGYAFCGEGTYPLGSIPGAVFDAPTKLSLVTGRRTPHPSALFLKKNFFKAGGYFNKDYPAEDLSLWLRMSSLGSFATTELDALKYRLSASSTTIMNRKNSIAQRKELLREYPLSVTYLDEVLENLDFILDRYLGMQSSRKRIVLLFMDIIAYRQFYHVKIPLKKFLKIFAHWINVYNLTATFQLFFEAHQRDKFRKSVLNHV